MTLYETLDVRRTVRSFQTDPIPRATLEKLVTYAAKGPTGCNDQGWVFVVVDDLATKAKVADITQWGKFIAQAGACIAIFCDKEATCVVEDCSVAAENILLAATAEGLAGCWVGSCRNENTEPVGKLLGCPATHELIALIAVGKPKEVPPSPPKKPLGEILRWNQF